MKKLAIASLLLVPVLAWATSTFTTHYNLEKPRDGSLNWGTAIRDNADKIDAQMYISDTEISDHVADSENAHASSAIGASPGTTCSTALSAQAYLDCLDSNISNFISSGIVTISTDQTITGNKTFSSPIGLSYGSLNTVPYINGSLKLVSSSVTSTELGYLSGLTGSIQTQINTKSPTSSPTFTGTVTSPAIIVSGQTANTVPYLNASKAITSSSVTPTELGYVSGVTSAIQTQLNAKAPIASPTFTGTVTAPTLSSTSITSTNITGTNYTGITLDDIGAPGANHSINMSNKTMTWNFTNPAGGMVWNFTGGATGHSLEIMQSGGNPSTDMHLLHIEAADADPTTLHLTPGSATSKALKINASGENAGPGRMLVDASGKITWGDGTSAVDTTLQRTGASALGLTGSLNASGNITSTSGTINGASNGIELAVRRNAGQTADIMQWQTEGSVELASVDKDGIITAAGFVGNLTGNATMITQKADLTHDGYLSKEDWNTFNSAAGGGISSLTGDVTTVGSGAAAATNVKASGDFYIEGTTDASSSTTGSLKTAGGLGIAKKLYVGTDANVGGVLGVTGVTTTAGIRVGSTDIAYAANSAKLFNQSGITYLDTMGPDGATQGTFSFRQLASDGSPFITSASTDTSGNWTLAGTISANGLSKITSTTATAGDATLRLQTASGNITTGTVLGNVDFYAQDASAGGTGIEAQIQGISEGAHTGAGSNKGAIAFFTKDDAATPSTLTERVRIASDGAMSLTKPGSATLSINTTSADGGRGILLRDAQGSPTRHNWSVGANFLESNTFEITPSTAVGGSTYSTPGLKILNTGAVTIPGTLTVTGAMTGNGTLTLKGDTSATISPMLTGNLLNGQGTTGVNANIQLTSFVGGAHYTGRRSAGTSASPSATGLNNSLVTFGGSGHGATGWASANRAAIVMTAAENWSDTNQGTKIDFQTTANTTTTTASALLLDHDKKATFSGAVGITGDVAVNTDKFNVAAASGDTTIAGSLTVTGGPTFSGGAANSTAMLIKGKTGGSGSVSINNDGSATVDFGDNATGMLIVSGVTTHQVATFILSTAGATEVSDPSSAYSTTSNNAGTTNVTWVDSTSVLTIQNKSGGSVLYNVALIQL